MANQREVSRQNWKANGPTVEEINAGSLQRIADAVEKMAQSYDAMRTDRDYWKDRAEWRMAEITRLERSNRSLRGVITRLKRSPRLRENRG